MSLQKALTDYKTALLEVAAGDLISRKAGLPQPNVAKHLTAARDNVMAEASKLTNDQFIAGLMVNNFLRGEL